MQWKVVMFQALEQDDGVILKGKWMTYPEQFQNILCSQYPRLKCLIFQQVIATDQQTQ